MKAKLFILILICIMPLVSSDLFPTDISSVSVGFNDGTEQSGVNVIIPPEIFNSSAATSNSTNNWITLSLGTLDDASTIQFDNVAGTLTIDTDYIDANWCALTGCTMEGDIDMDGNNILFTNSGSGIQRVINATSTNPNGVIGYELNNDVGASIALSIAGSNIPDFANDSGIISRGGRTFIVNAANKDIVMGHGELPSVVPTWTLNPDGTVTQTGDLIMNGSAIFLDGNQQHFIKENIDGFPFNGISTNAEWFGHDEFNESGEITFLFTHENDTNLWLQSGKNNSFSSIGNSFVLVPTYMANNNFTENGVINMTKASSYLILCDIFDIDCNFNADTRGNAIDSIPGGPLLATMGDLEVWQSAKIHKGLSVEGPVFFDLEGTTANFNNGPVHMATGVTFEEGFTAGDSVTKFTETFASGLGIFSNIQSDFGNWVNVLNSVVCDEGECAEGDGAGSGLVEMQTNFSTSDINETTLSFVYSLVNLVGAGEFSIEVNNNVGSGDVEIFSDTTTSVIKSSQVIALPSSMNDQPLVTLTVICNIGSSNKPTRQCFFDTAKINGTAISTTLINVSGFNSIIAFSDGTLDADGFPLRGIIYNASGDEIIFRGNVTFENIIEQDLNVTNSISLNGTTIFDWAGVVDSPFFPEYFLTNGSSVMQGNTNIGGFNITNADWGFFNNLNISSLFVDDIFPSTNGPITLNGNTTIDLGHTTDMLNILPVQILGSLWIPELSGGVGLMSVKDFLYIRSDAGTPSIIFSNKDASDIVTIGYNNGTDEVSFNGAVNYNFDGNVTALSFLGDGSFLTGIINGIWNNVSGVATYDGNANVTGNITTQFINGIKTNITTDGSNDTINIYLGDGGSLRSSYTQEFASGDNMFFSDVCPIEANFHPEETSDLSTITGGGRQFAYGNGNLNAYGPEMPCGGYILIMSMDCENSPNTNGRVQMAKNGVALGTACQVSSTGSNFLSDIDKSCSSLTFEAGDQLTPITTTSSTGTNGCTVSFYVRFTNP